MSTRTEMAAQLARQAKRLDMRMGTTRYFDAARKFNSAKLQAAFDEEYNRFKPRKH